LSAPLRSTVSGSTTAQADLRLIDPLGERRVAREELPLTIGGEGARIAVPGIAPDLVVGEIGTDEDGVYVEAAAEVPEGASRLRVNGRVPQERRRLQANDVLTAGDARIFADVEARATTLRVVHLADNATAAPLVDEDAETGTLEDQSTSQTITRARFSRFAGGRVARASSSVGWRWAVAAGSAAVAIVIWFFAIAVSVQVRADPAGAEVDFDGAWPEISLGDRHLVRPGAYTLVASNEGFATTRRPVRVGGGADPRIDVALVRLPGKVTFDTQGIAATASVDGKPLGALPGMYEVPAGEHEMIVRATRYLELKTRIDVEGGGLPQDIELQLTPAFAPVTVESRPAGARVLVNGQEVGATPVTTELDGGSHTVTLVAEGFKNWESAIQVQANTPQKIGPVELGLPDGKLTVRSRPAQADVAIAGSYRGRTPLEIDLAPGVEHDIVVQRAGFEPARRRVPIKPAERLAIEIALKPILGDVTVRGEPADAVLFVGGEQRGPANQTLSLPAVETAIEVRKAGLETFATTVTPQPGIARVVEYKLQSAEEKRTAKFPTTVQLKSGGEVKLMPTGTYQMGSPRREPGRRANESQRSVTLQRPFYIGTREVTNGEFRQYRKEHLSGVVGERSLDLDKQPAVSLNWREAVDFCNWLSEQEGLPAAYVKSGERMVAVSPMTTGYRLPTEAEWEWAARYERGAATRRFPWGASLPVASNSGNYADVAAAEVIGGALEGYTDTFIVTAPVGSYAPNALGLYDIGGNVQEWTHDYYSSYIDLREGSNADPTGPTSGLAHVVRGSSWRTASITELRLAFRDAAEGRSQHLGFRVARYAE